MPEQDSFAEEAKKLSDIKEAKLQQLRLARKKKKAADAKAAGKGSNISKAANFGKGGPPPTAPKPFYKKFTIFCPNYGGYNCKALKSCRSNYLINAICNRYIGASTDTTVGELKQWGYFNAFPSECTSIYKVGFAFDGIELAETMTMGQLGMDRGIEIRKRPIIMNPSRYPILERNADDGLQVESDAEDDADHLNLKKKKKKEDMTDSERRQAALTFFSEKCKRSFPDTTDISSEDLKAMLDANNQKIIFVDCRSAPECLVSMIPGAISQKEFQSVVVPVLLGQKKRPKDAPWKIPVEIVTYCGNFVRSGKLVQKLQSTLTKAKSGLKLLNHKGSISDWCHVGGPLVEGRKQGKGGKILRGTGAPTAKVHACTRRFIPNFPTEMGLEIIV